MAMINYQGATGIEQIIMSHTHNPSCRRFYNGASRRCVIETVMRAFRDAVIISLTAIDSGNRALQWLDKAGQEIGFVAYQAARLNN